MTLTLVLMAVLMGGIALWLFRQSLHVQPWVAESGPGRSVPAPMTAPRTGLGVFLAVVTSVFSLTISAYLMRREMGADWRSLTMPGVIWVNSALLVLASLALQLAWRAAGHGQEGRLWRALLAGGGLTLAFVAGQCVAWVRLEAAGYYLAANPANAFFYLLTVLHALHLLGGLVAWGRVLVRARGGTPAVQLRPSVELCALYWHFLLLVWGVILGLVLAT
ncbi:cytochrome oxidase subunit III [Halomonas sp. M4R1S46]|uniref:cytochrome oxidase subunit III n=1 Tax=Halomonas sp. M4R1S46 TaxID=2982692 RepID=UPI0021E3A127|nr:cytochrome oxidase subunit III [Halomonas sp. M4R1S46]UYG09425.1 cytochrome oxidase subunit III [Halomonas sp. M4R1S46]